MMIIFESFYEIRMIVIIVMKILKSIVYLISFILFLVLIFILRTFLLVLVSFWGM